MKTIAKKELGQFIRSELSARLAPQAIVCVGPAVRIDAAAGTALTPALHRLIAIAREQHALPAGREVVIAWELDERGGCTITCETSGAPILNGASTATSLPIASDDDTGIRCEILDHAARIIVPPQHVSPDAEASNVVPISKVTDPIRGNRMLVVEDQLIIALDLEMLLLEQGAEEVKVFGTAAEALKSIARSRPDAAVLDVNLGHSTSFPVAQELMRLGVPFIFATGYGNEIEFPVELRSVPLVGKPYCAQMIRDALATCRMADAAA
jgi:CheY-like chemotaxis protein